MLISIWIHNYDLARILSESGSRLAGVEFLSRLKSVLNFLSVGMGSSLNRCSASCPYSYCDSSCCDFCAWLLHTLRFRQTNYFRRGLSLFLSLQFNISCIMDMYTSKFGYVFCLPFDFSFKLEMQPWCGSLLTEFSSHCAHLSSGYSCSISHLVCSIDLI